MPFSDEEWERAAGDECPECKQAALRFAVFRRKRICVRCKNDQEAILLSLASLPDKRLASRVKRFMRS